MLDLAGRPSAPYALGAVSFAESSFFPVPPDVMLVPMALARPRLAWRYAALCTVTSVLGGVAGTHWGAALRHGRAVALPRLRLDSGAAAFREAYARYGAWIILLKGLHPRSPTSS
jgi:membrane protein YqaA with SNARE-associated domain